MEKYELKTEDWENLPLVDLKLKQQNVVYLFDVLINMLSSNITPLEVEMLESTRNHLLKQLDSLKK